MKTVCDTRYDWFHCACFGGKGATGGLWWKVFLCGVVRGEDGWILVGLDDGLCWSFGECWVVGFFAGLGDVCVR